MKKFHHEELDWCQGCTLASCNKVKNALNKSPSLRADFPKFDQIPDNLRFIEALTGLDSWPCAASQDKIGNKLFL